MALNSCCWRWRFGAFSKNKAGEPSSGYGRDIIKYCPECGKGLDNEEERIREQLDSIEQALDKLEERVRAIKDV
jgi:hypothetical protein